MNAFSPKVTTRNSTCEGSRTGNTCGPSGAEAAPARLRGAGGGGERREAAPHLQQSAGGGQPGGLAEHVPRGHPLPARPGPTRPCPAGRKWRWRRRRRAAISSAPPGPPRPAGGKRARGATPAPKRGERSAHRGARNGAG